VIFISHRLKEVFQVADRVTVLRDGKRVLTTEVAGASVDDLVRAMVGTELSARVVPQGVAGSVGEEAIRVEGPVRFAVRRGEVVGLAGLAGAGRTELLEWLFGAGTRTGQVFCERPAGEGADAARRHPSRHGAGA